LHSTGSGQVRLGRNSGKISAAARAERGGCKHQSGKVRIGFFHDKKVGKIVGDKKMTEMKKLEL
jgi:hypothetical protein